MLFPPLEQGRVSKNGIDKKAKKDPYLALEADSVSNNSIKIYLFDALSTARARQVLFFAISMYIIFSILYFVFLRYSIRL